MILVVSIMHVQMVSIDRFYIAWAGRNHKVSRKILSNATMRSTWTKALKMIGTHVALSESEFTGNVKARIEILSGKTKRNGKSIRRLSKVSGSNST